MPKITINGKEIEFEKGMTVLQACELADVEIPRFCYHEKLSIAETAECAWLKWRNLQNQSHLVLCLQQRA